MSNSIELDSIRIDFLREICNIGGGNAATSLSVLLNSELKIDIPKVKILEFNELTEMLGGAENLVAAVLSPVVGDLKGMMMFVLEEKHAKHLAHKLVSGENDSMTFSDIDLSAIKEIGNILISTYLGSLESLSTLQVRISQPELCVDMAGAILSIPAIEFGDDGDKALVLQTAFYDNADNINGYIMLISELHSYDRMYEALGIR